MSIFFVFFACSVHVHGFWEKKDKNGEYEYENLEATNNRQT